MKNGRFHANFTRGRTATQCSEKGSEKVLRRVLGKGSRKGSRKGSEKGPDMGFTFSEGVSEKGFSGRCLERPL